MARTGNPRSSRGTSSQSAPGPTSQDPQRRVQRAAESTKPAQHRLPVSGPQSGHMTLRARPDTTAVTGPSAWENGRDQLGNPGAASLSGSSASDVNPC